MSHMVGTSKNWWKFRNSDAISDLFWSHCVAFYVFLVVCHSFSVTMPASPYNLFFLLFLLAWWCNMHIRKLPRFFGCIDLKIGKIFWVVSNSNEILWKAFKWRYIVIFVCWKVYVQCTYICFKLVKIYVEEIINEMLLRR